MLGHNKNFLASPAQYLASNTLFVSAPHAHGSPLAHLNNAAPGLVHQFDLRPTGWGAQLVPFVPHPKTHAHGTQRPLNAYFLDYQHDRAMVTAIGAAADILFTPILDGCYFGHGGGLVTHVAGDFGQRDANKRQQAQTALGAPVADGFDSNQAESDEVTIVGIRLITGWTFYAQGHEPNYQQFGRRQPLFSAGPGAGQAVLRFQGLTYG